jgi:hypothetical protein
MTSTPLVHRGRHHNRSSQEMISTSLSYLFMVLTVVEAASQLLRNAAARVRAQVRARAIPCAQSSIGEEFLRVLIPVTATHSSSLIRGRYRRPNSADVPSALSLTPNKKLNKHVYLTYIAD